MTWRWSAPIGFTGAWSDGDQQAPWFDDGMDYCITIGPRDDDVAVHLAEHPGGSTGQCGFIPAQHRRAAMLRTT